MKILLAMIILFLSTELFATQNNIQIVDSISFDKKITITNAFYDKKSDKIFIFDIHNALIYKYDTEIEKIIDTININEDMKYYFSNKNDEVWEQYPNMSGIVSMHKDEFTDKIFVVASTLMPLPDNNYGKAYLIGELNPDNTISGIYPMHDEETVISNPLFLALYNNQLISEVRIIPKNQTGTRIEYSTSIGKRNIDDNEYTYFNFRKQLDSMYHINIPKNSGGAWHSINDSLFLYNLTKFIPPVVVNVNSNTIKPLDPNGLMNSDTICKDNFTYSDDSLTNITDNVIYLGMKTIHNSIYMITEKKHEDEEVKGIKYLQELNNDMKLMFETTFILPEHLQPRKYIIIEKIDEIILMVESVDKIFIFKTFNE